MQIKRIILFEPRPTKADNQEKSNNIRGFGSLRGKFTPFYAAKGS